jgi:hypothetical protein
MDKQEQDVLDADLCADLAARLETIPRVTISKPPGTLATLQTLFGVDAVGEVMGNVQQAVAAEAQVASDGRPAITVPVLRCDEPTINGRIYPQAVVVRAVEEAQERLRIGKIMAVYTYDPSHPGVNMRDMVGDVREISMEGREVVATLRLYDTLRGRACKEMVATGRVPRFTLTGHGNCEWDKDKRNDMVSKFDIDGVLVDPTELQGTKGEGR